MKRLLMAALLGGCGTASPREGAEGPPNVVVLVSDDQGWADFSAYEHSAKDVRTPNLDRMAARGIRFTQAYSTASICSPSRSGFLTGRYQQRWGAEHYGTANLSEGEITLPMLLKRRGYVTGKVGKTHHGRHNPDSFHFPLRHGFDEFFGFMHHTKHYLRHTAADGALHKGGNLDAGPMWVNGDQKDQEGYATTLFRDAAVDFIRRHRARPFYLQVSFNAVHLFTNQLPAADLKKAGLPGAKDWDPRKAPGRKGYVDWYRGHLKNEGDDPEPHDPAGRGRYLVALDHLDRAVGAILDELEAAGVGENTLVVYFSDNGGSPRTYALNKPLRGYKYKLFEGGIRVPFVVSWPRKLKQGIASHRVVSTLDVLPTVAAAVGVELPVDREYDGLNLLEDTLVGSRTLFWSMGRNAAQRLWAVRDGDWKLLHDPEQGDSLFNLKDDPGETKDRARELPGLVAELSARYADWRGAIGRP